jgi:hypothetical protein
MDEMEADEDVFDDPTDITATPYDATLTDDPDVAFRPHGGTHGPHCHLVHHDASGDIAYGFRANQLTIGRGRENDVQIRNDSKVSRRHCRIVCDGTAAFIEDLGSANGTFVRDEQVVRQPLFGGEPIVVGSTRFRFQAEPLDEALEVTHYDV